MFIVRTLEPDRLGGSKKQLSKEYFEPSQKVLQDDPERAEEEARMLMEQQRKDKKRNKKKEYMKKKRAKLMETAKVTDFDHAILLNYQQLNTAEGASAGSRLMRTVP
jgi:hypothetical protein